MDETVAHEMYSSAMYGLESERSAQLILFSVPLLGVYKNNKNTVGENGDFQNTRKYLVNGK